MNTWIIRITRALATRLGDLIQLPVRHRASIRAAAGRIMALNLTLILDSTKIRSFRRDNSQTAFKEGKEAAILEDQQA